MILPLINHDYKLLKVVKTFIYMQKLNPAQLRLFPTGMGLIYVHSLKFQVISESINAHQFSIFIKTCKNKVLSRKALPWTLFRPNKQV